MVSRTTSARSQRSSGASFWLFRAHSWLVLAGLASSGMLLVDYSRPAPVFCVDSSSGCAALRASAWSHIGPVPLPVVGLVGLFVLFVIASLRGARVRLAHAVLGGIALVTGVVLLVVQATRGELCPYCVVTDSAAALAGVLGMYRQWQSLDPVGSAGSRSMRFAVTASGAVVAGLGAFLLSTPLADVGSVVPSSSSGEPQKAPVPVFDVLRDELSRTPAGKVLVLDFLDFECPFCRALHHELEPFLAAHEHALRVVRYHVPLASHPHALPAAEAALCGARQGQGEPMLERIMALTPQQMTTAAFAGIAASLGLEPARFDACLHDGTVAEELARHKEAWKSTGADGLPTLYVGTKRFVGAPQLAQVRAAFDEASSVQR